jgi:hypothetical protein
MSHVIMSPSFDALWNARRINLQKIMTDSSTKARRKMGGRDRKLIAACFSSSMLRVSVASVVSIL